VGDPSVDIRFLSARDVDELSLSTADVLEAVEASLRAQGEGEVVLEPREHLVPDPAFHGHFNLLRAYVRPLGVAGVKVVGDYADNYRIGLPSELALLTLYDPRTGVPLAIVDATEITERRTGAVTAIGARHLARQDAKVLGHIGARGTAFSNVTMLDAEFDFEEIRVTSRRPESREAFGAALEEALGKRVEVVESAEEAVWEADIVVEATRLIEPTPLLRTDWIGAGALVVPYGTISAVELSLTTVMDKIVVDDWQQCRRGRFGALRPHVERGLLSEANLHAELGQIVAGGRSGRERDDERILFWHRGLATTDLAVGHLLYERAVERGVGTVLHYR
jgi:ornithine cyclodeaminase/alanine dehydrogenase-like protein (mu-crystallin family)